MLPWLVLPWLVLWSNKDWVVELEFQLDKLPPTLKMMTMAHQARQMATLSDKPTTIHDLWREDTHGIGGQVPAKAFRRRERGRCKHNYSRRNLVWRVIKELVLAGVDADVACDRIYQAYGRGKSISYIISMMYNDKSRAGGRRAIGESWKHPNLRVGA